MPLNPKIEAAIELLAVDMPVVIEAIETNPQTTRGHYGAYLSAIPRIAGDGPTMQRIVSLALIRAGANANGVRDAMRILAP